MEKNSLKKGVNLGGWLSQFKKYDHEHFGSFIQKEDIRRIAGWGFDHVRLPVDYSILEKDSAPGNYLESGLDYISTCMAWCCEIGLRVILDLHKAPGYAFDAQLENTIDKNPDMQNRFFGIWQAITKRFRSTDPDLLAFELLNEVNFPDSEIWNNLVEKAVEIIRSIDDQRLILVGGNCYSSVDYLDEIRIIADQRILYKFHYYLPHAVTHQKAYWLEGLFEFNSEVAYPGKAAGLSEFLMDHPEYRPRLEEEAGAYFDRDYLHRRLKSALEFSNCIGQPIHCGEFGVIDRAPMQTRLNWTRDIVSLFDENAIGYAYWSYKAMDFGLVDHSGKVVSQELIGILTRG